MNDMMSCSVTGDLCWIEKLGRDCAEPKLLRKDERKHNIVLGYYLWIYMDPSLA